MDEISQEFLREIDKLSIKYHRQLKIIVKFDEAKGVYPAYRIIEYIPKTETITPEMPETTVEPATQDIDPKEFEETPPQGQIVEIAKKNVEA